MARKKKTPETRVESSKSQFFRDKVLPDVLRIQKSGNRIKIQTMITALDWVHAYSKDEPYRVAVSEAIADLRASLETCRH